MFNDITPIQCISDICNLQSPLSTPSNSSLPLVIFYMDLMKVEAAGIIDEQDHCIGFVTYKDLIDYEGNKKQNIKYPHVSEVMRAPNMSVYLDDPIEQAMVMMKIHRIDWLPVIDFDTQHFSALICRQDIESLSTNIIAFPPIKFPQGNAA